MQQIILESGATYPLKFWVIILYFVPLNLISFKYHTSAIEVCIADVSLCDMKSRLEKMVQDLATINRIPSYTALRNRDAQHKNNLQVNGDTRGKCP